MKTDPGGASLEHDFLKKQKVHVLILEASTHCFTVTWLSLLQIRIPKWCLQSCRLSPKPS